MSEPGKEGLAYRRGVGLMLLNRDGLVFVARRGDVRTDAWQMPQGGIDAGETPRDAALRELREETGTDKAEIVRESERWFSYDLPEELIGKAWGGGYRGQTLKWFAFRFTGRDEDIALDRHEPEFVDWRWVPADRLPHLIVPFKRQVYLEVLREFGDVIRPA